MESALCGLLDLEVKREDHIFPSFRRRPNVFGLPVAEAVDQDRFHAGSASQFLVEGAFDAHDPAVVRQTKIEESIFVNSRAVILDEETNQMRGHHMVRVTPKRLHLQIQAGGIARLLLETGDLDRRQIRQHKERQRQLIRVML